MTTIISMKKEPFLPTQSELALVAVILIQNRPNLSKMEAARAALELWYACGELLLGERLRHKQRK